MRYEQKKELGYFRSRAMQQRVNKRMREQDGKVERHAICKRRAL